MFYLKYIYVNSFDEFKYMIYGYLIFIKYYMIGW
jgi:hypothetical protein